MVSSSLLYGIAFCCAAILLILVITMAKLSSISSAQVTDQWARPREISLKGREKHGRALNICLTTSVIVSAIFVLDVIVIAVMYAVV